MTKLNWIVTAYVNGVNTQIQNKVLSININQGREKYLDTYSGGTCSITIKNDGDYASGIPYGSSVRIYDNNTGFFDLNLSCCKSLSLLPKRLPIWVFWVKTLLRFSTTFTLFEFNSFSTNELM